MNLRSDFRFQTAFRAGERDALERVYRAHAPSIERYALSLIRPRSAAFAARAIEVADLVQEVFIRAFSDEARRGYGGAHDYGRYLAAIARNCFIDALRSKNREIAVDPAELPQHPYTLPETEHWNDTKIVAVFDAYVRDLPPALRLAYEHRFIGESSQEQTAAELGISRKAVRLAEQKLRVGLRRAFVQAGIPLRHRPDVSVHRQARHLNEQI